VTDAVSILDREVRISGKVKCANVTRSGGRVNFGVPQRRAFKDFGHIGFARIRKHRESINPCGVSGSLTASWSLSKSKGPPRSKTVSSGNGSLRG
jgi:hypothetical protein